MACCFPLLLLFYTCMYNVNSFQLPVFKSNGLVHRDQIFINVELCVCIKTELVIINTAEFFLIKQGLLTMCPINKTNNSFFGLGISQIGGRPLLFQVVYSIQCLIKLKQLYFPIDYQVSFQEYLIKLNYLFCHTVSTT